MAKPETDLQVRHFLVSRQILTDTINYESDLPAGVCAVSWTDAEHRVFAVADPDRFRKILVKAHEDKFHAASLPSLSEILCRAPPTMEILESYRKRHHKQYAKLVATSGGTEHCRIVVDDSGSRPAGGLTYRFVAPTDPPSPTSPASGAAGASTLAAAGGAGEDVQRSKDTAMRSYRPAGSPRESSSSAAGAGAAAAARGVAAEEAPPTGVPSAERVLLDKVLSDEDSVSSPWVRGVHPFQAGGRLVFASGYAAVAAVESVPTSHVASHHGSFRGFVMERTDTSGAGPTEERYVEEAHIKISRTVRSTQPRDSRWRSPAAIGAQEHLSCIPRSDGEPHKTEECMHISCPMREIECLHAILALDSDEDGDWDGTDNGDLTESQKLTQQRDWERACVVVPLFWWFHKGKVLNGTVEVDEAQLVLITKWMQTTAADCLIRSEFATEWRKPRNAVALFHAAALALHCMHRKQWAHCDVSLENLLVSNANPGDEADPKVSQLAGMSQAHQGRWIRVRKGLRGQSYNRAPEAWAAHSSCRTLCYDGFSADMFSLGHCLFTVLTGEVICGSRAYGKCWTTDTPGGSGARAAEAINNDTLDNYLRKHYPRQLFDDARHLIVALMRGRPSQRATWEQVFQHPWFNEGQKDWFGTCYKFEPAPVSSAREPMSLDSGEIDYFDDDGPLLPWHAEDSRLAFLGGPATRLGWLPRPSAYEVFTADRSGVPLKENSSQLQAPRTTTSLGKLKELLDNGNVQEAVRLIDRGDAGVNDTFENGETPLVCAVRKSDIVAVRELLDRNADPDVPELSKWTDALDPEILAALAAARASTVSTVREGAGDEKAGFGAAAPAGGL